ncbi:MAG: xylose isomerase domain-containing protein [Parcubacteria group bacterium LiPW_72]|nr:MAG: xylose isomerase domain-containing protein [Parcubacteria group bacterium LiPW_72]
MARPVTLFTGQWADLPLDKLVDKVVEFGYDGVELACWGDHFDVKEALLTPDYCKKRVDALRRKGLGVWAISNHLVGQAVCDNIDIRHKSILPPEIWGEGNPKAINIRAAERMKETAKAAEILADVVGHEIVVCGFTGSSIWHLLYSFPPVTPEMIDAGYKDFADKWNPILDVFDMVGVKFALEAHPTEIAFDVVSAERALKALDNRKAFGFNYDPSHFVYQGVDYIKFLEMFGDRIYHVHMKDAWKSDKPTLAGTFGGHTNFGDLRRNWDFRSLGRGSVDFEEIIRMLNRVNYQGPLSVEWEDSGMDREHGAVEACDFVKALDFPPSATAFDAAFEKKAT